VNEECDLHGKAGQDNLIVRKTYGKDHIRYLRCRECRAEFSERKGTALWNTKIAEEKAVQVAQHLNEGCSQASTTRLVGVDKTTVNRLAKRIGQHAKAFHEAKVRDVDVDVLQADERHGFAGDKETEDWEGELMDPESKMVLSFVTGRESVQVFV
jgi:transposase-like protein